MWTYKWWTKYLVSSFISRATLITDPFQVRNTIVTHAVLVLVLHPAKLSYVSSSNYYFWESVEVDNNAESASK